MKVVWAALIIVGAAGVAGAAMLLMRRKAPDGSWFNDGDRASGVPQSEPPPCDTGGAPR
jgi:hypothetical protein